MYKRNLIVIIACCAPFSLSLGEERKGAGKAEENQSISQVLRGIETNNKELQANAQWFASQKLEARTVNNLPDPSLSYAHLWGAKNKSETIGELVVSQSFDFPSLYATRRQLNRLKAGAYDRQADVLRQNILLRAKETCLDIISLRQQKKLLEERLRNAEELSKMYTQRLETGDANILETNKIRLELLNVRTEVSMNEMSLLNLLQELTALNGNLPVVFEEEQYPEIPFPIDYLKLKEEIMTSDRTLVALEDESLVARKQIAVNKSQWLPKLELGYRRNTESGVAFNGVVVGFSFPFFENRNKVKVSRAQALNIDLQKKNAALQAESGLMQLYREAEMSHQSMKEYQEAFRSEQNLELLKQAVTSGQINMIEYFMEVSVIYQSHWNYLQLENRYQKAMAEIYKSRL